MFTIGLDPGTVVISETAVDALFRPQLDLVSNLKRLDMIFSYYRAVCAGANIFGGGQRRGLFFSVVERGDPNFFTFFFALKGGPNFFAVGKGGNKTFQRRQKKGNRKNWPPAITNKRYALPRKNLLLPHMYPTLLTNILSMFAN